MIDTKMLFSKIVLKGENWGDLARLLGISKQALALKKNGDYSWSQKQIKTIVDHYELTPQETLSIFFSDEVECNSTRS